MSKRDVGSLMLAMNELKARERLTFILDLQSALPGDQSAHYMTSLVQAAYPDDRELQAVIIEAISRKA